MAMNLDDHEVRRLYAELNVLRTLVEAMLAEQVRDFTEDGRRESFDALFQIGSRLEHRTTDDEEAEVAADLAVRTQERLGTILQRVAKRTGTDWTPPVPGDLLSGILRRS